METSELMASGRVGARKGGKPSSPHCMDSLPVSISVPARAGMAAAMCPPLGAARRGVEEPRLASSPAGAGSNALLSKPAHAPWLIPLGCLWDECRDVVSGSSLLPALAGRGLSLGEGTAWARGMATPYHDPGNRTLPTLCRHTPAPTMPTHPAGTHA